MSNYRRTVINPTHLKKKIGGLVKVTLEVVHSSYSLPNWQDVKLTFFASWVGYFLIWPKQVGATNRVWLSGSQVLKRVSVILLQIVVLSHGTLLEKNRESQSITIKSQFKKAMSQKLKMCGPLCNQTVNLKTDSKLCTIVY